MFTAGQTKHKRVVLGASGKRDVRTQFASLCWREHKGKPQMLLVTSRRSKRWILPKGWPMDGQTPVAAAEQEAWEEAGVRGKMAPTCVGIYNYTKELKQGFIPVIVAVFALQVKKQKSVFPEADERHVKWVSFKKAAKMVKEPGLRAIIRGFAPGKPVSRA